MIPGLGRRGPQGTRIVARHADQPRRTAEVPGEPPRRIFSLRNRGALVILNLNPTGRPDSSFKGHLERWQPRRLETEPVFVQLHPNQGQLMVLTLAKKPPVVADQHPPPVELETGGADRRQVDLDSTT